MIDPLPGWEALPAAPYRFPGDNLHYTAAGAELLAGVVATQVPPE